MSLKKKKLSNGILNWIAIFALIFVCVRSARANDSANQKVRKIHLKRDEIAQVKTSLGIATLIQVPDRPTSVVLGDTNAFKIEYLENAITIKPLSHSSKSNLYIYTEGRRFSVSLVTLPISSADYIVYLEPEIAQPDPKREKWRDYSTKNKNHDFTLCMKRIGKADGFLMITFQISTLKPTNLKPDWIWLTQGGRTVPIQDLNLSGVTITEREPVSAFLTFKESDLKAGVPTSLEIRSPTPVKVRLPEVRSWLK
jgi:hypothetical protein